MTDSKLWCDVYRSGKNSDMYLYVKRSKGLEDVPDALKQQFGKPELALTLALTPEKQLARADIEQVLNALEERGYYLQMPPRPDAYMQSINSHNDKLATR